MLMSSSQPRRSSEHWPLSLTSPCTLPGFYASVVLCPPRLRRQSVPSSNRGRGRWAEATLRQRLDLGMERFRPTHSVPSQADNFGGESSGCQYEPRVPRPIAGHLPSLLIGIRPQPGQSRRASCRSTAAVDHSDARIILLGDVLRTRVRVGRHVHCQKRTAMTGAASCFFQKKIVRICCF